MNCKVSLIERSKSKTSVGKYSVEFNNFAESPKTVFEAFCIKTYAQKYAGIVLRLLAK